MDSRVARRLGSRLRRGGKRQSKRKGDEKRSASWAGYKYGHRRGSQVRRRERGGKSKHSHGGIRARRKVRPKARLGCPSECPGRRNHTALIASSNTANTKSASAWVMFM